MRGSARPIRNLLTGSLLVLSGLLAVPGAAQQQSVPVSAAEVRLSFAPVVRTVAPAVVNVNAERRSEGGLSPLFDDPFFRRFFERFGPAPGPRRRQTSLGSGVIVDAAGTVVTNHHVVAGADAITVILADRREFAAERLRSDEALDLAVLRLRDVDEALPAVSYGESDALAVGDLVLAIGNPFGIGQSVSSGIVSATARSGGGLGVELPLIQTDAAINPGNSGGALVDVAGRLIGVNTAILTRGGGSNGVGFAIPSNVVRAYVMGDIAAEPDARPWLGAQLQDLDHELAEGLGLERPRGALVAAVHPGAAGADAGLRPGDVVLTMDGVPTETVGDVGLRLALAGAKRSVAMQVWRREAEVTLTLQVKPAPRVPPPDPVTFQGAHPLAGLRVANLSPAFALEVGLDPYREGVVVLDVAPGSPAARVRLRPGDVFVEIDGRSIREHRELEAAFVGETAGRRILIERGGRRLQLVLG